jgi:hypothetical protein
MVRKNIITLRTEELVAYHTLKSGADIVAKRMQRQLVPLAEDVYSRLMKRQRVPESALVVADYRFEDKDLKARTLKEGIDEFSKRYPEYGEILNGIISETRKTKRRYLIFGQNDELPQEIYAAALEKAGIAEEKEGGLIDNIRSVSEKFSKKRKDGTIEMLIK